MIKQQIVNRLKKTYCRLKRSKIQGVGIFAIRDIPKGTNIFQGIHEQRHFLFKLAEFKKLDPGIRKMINDFFFLNDDGMISVPEYGLNGMDISFFLNESKTPNVKTIDGGMHFVAARKIKKGEELTSYYQTYY